MKERGLAGGSAQKRLGEPIRNRIRRQLGRQDKWLCSTRTGRSAERAVVLPAVGAPPHRLAGDAVSLMSSPGATKSANSTKTAKKALKTAKKADKTAKKALAEAKKAKARTGPAGPAGPAGAQGAAGPAGAQGPAGTATVSDGEITTAKLGNDAVTSAKIADGTITAGDLATDSVGADEIQTGAVGSAEVATDAVGSDEIAAGAVTAAEILDGTIAIGDITQSVWSGSAHRRHARFAPRRGRLQQWLPLLRHRRSGGTLYRSNGSAGRRWRPVQVTAADIDRRASDRSRTVKLGRRRRHGREIATGPLRQPRSSIRHRHRRHQPGRLVGIRPCAGTLAVARSGRLQQRLPLLRHRRLGGTLYRSNGTAGRRSRPEWRWRRDPDGCGHDRPSGRRCRHDPMKVAANTLTAADIAADAVASSELADRRRWTRGAETTRSRPREIAADAVGRSEIASDAVTSTEILDATVRARTSPPTRSAPADIATDGVGADELADDSVDAAAIQADAVDPRSCRYAVATPLARYSRDRRRDASPRPNPRWDDRDRRHQPVRVVGIGPRVGHPCCPPRRRGLQQRLPLLRHRRLGRHALPLERRQLGEGRGLGDDPGRRHRRRCDHERRLADRRGRLGRDRRRPIAGADVAADAVGASQLADNSVDNAALQDDAVTSAEIADGTITGGDIAADTITAADIAADAVGSSELADNSVDDAALQDNAVTRRRSRRRRRIRRSRPAPSTPRSSTGRSPSATSTSRSGRASAHAAGTLAARPAAAASNNGFLYFATDDLGRHALPLERRLLGEGRGAGVGDSLGHRDRRRRQLRDPGRRRRLALRSRGRRRWLFRDRRRRGGLFRDRGRRRDGLRDRRRRRHLRGDRNRRRWNLRDRHQRGRICGDRGRRRYDSRDPRRRRSRSATSTSRSGRAASTRPAHSPPPAAAASNNGFLYFATDDSAARSTARTAARGSRSALPATVTAAD